MPGGKGNIKPEDGKQFSKDYQPSEKWTEKKAIEVGKHLIEWLLLEDENIFYDEFLFLKEDYHPHLITYLRNKFTSFQQLIEKAKKIQEIKLKKFGCFDKLNSSMTKFTLINNHNWTDRNENENKNQNINIDVEATPELLKKIDKMIEDEY
jgi:hypothetical protein